MIIPFVILIVFFISCTRYCNAIPIKGAAESNYNYLSIESTDNVKGVFILLVFLNHIAIKTGVYSSDFVLNTVYAKLFVSFINQAVVSLFMLYSGYAVMLCIDKKGNSYIKTFPKNRILKTLFNFDIIILIYLSVILIFLHKSIIVKKILLSFIAWETLGYSFWYIFTILILYIITYLSFCLFKDKKKAVISVALLTIIYIIVMHCFTNKLQLWYDTSLIYSAGMASYLIRDKAESLLTKKKQNYIYAVLLLLTVYLLFVVIGNNLILVMAKYLAFALLILFISMKFRLKNVFTEYCGKSLLYIYLLQGLVFIVLDYFDMKKYPIMYGVISVSATFAIIPPVKFLITKLDNLLFKKT